MRASVWRLFNALAVVRGVWAPFFNAIPLPCHLTVSFPSKSLPGGNYRWMFHAATMVVVFFVCLGILNSTCQTYHELFCNSFNSTRIMTLLVFIITSVLFFQMHQMHSRLFWMGWLPLSFLRGKKLVALCLGGVLVA